jgi:hypothetical protein
MDGRNVTLYPDEMVAENLEFYSNDLDAADVSAPLRHDTDLLLIPTDRPILEPLKGDARWRVLHQDRDAVIFARTESPLRLAPSAAVTEADRAPCGSTLE